MEAATTTCYHRVGDGEEAPRRRRRVRVCALLGALALGWCPILSLCTLHAPYLCPAPRTAFRVCPLLATLLCRARTSSTSRSASTRPASRTCVRCSPCADLPHSALTAPCAHASCTPRSGASCVARLAPHLYPAPHMTCLRLASDPRQWAEDFNQPLDFDISSVGAMQAMFYVCSTPRALRVHSTPRALRLHSPLHAACRRAGRHAYTPPRGICGSCLGVPLQSREYLYRVPLHCDSAGRKVSVERQQAAHTLRMDGLPCLLRRWL